MKGGEFEVLQRRKGVNIRVNMKRRGDTFGEVALMFNCPRSATVAATRDSVVWVLDRDVFRQHVREVQENDASQLELFLNSGWLPQNWLLASCAHAVAAPGVLLSSWGRQLLPDSSALPAGCAVAGQQAKQNGFDLWTGCHWRGEGRCALRRSRWAISDSPSWSGCFGAAVPILAPLSREEKLKLLDAFEEQQFLAGQTVVRQVSLSTSPAMQWVDSSLCI